MTNMETLPKALIFLLNFGLTSADNDVYGGAYCYGYCSGIYGHQYCVDNNYYYYDYGDNITAGAKAGIVIGSLIVLAIIVSVIIAIVCGCNRTGGTRGRIVTTTSATNGLTVMHSNSNGVFHTTEAAHSPPYPAMTYQASYPQALTVPPPPPSYTSYEPQPPPPSYISTTAPPQESPDDIQPHPPLNTKLS